MRFMKLVTAASVFVAMACGSAMATPTGQIWIPSTDVKAIKEVTVNITSMQRFSSKPDAGPSTYDAGVTAGVLPFEAVKMELGIDYLTSNKQDGTAADKHPIYFNAKLATPEDLGVKGLPAFAIGAYNLGTYDKSDANTRQNIVYGLVAKTLPVIGRISAGGYNGSKRALAINGNVMKNNTGLMLSWDRTISEISDKLWAGVDYMSGNNANGQIGFGASWAFSKQVTLLGGVQIFNPFAKTFDGVGLAGGKPAFTTQLFINF